MIWLKSGFSWLIDQCIEHWPSIVVAIVGGGGLGYLAYATAWVNKFGPIAWGITFFVGSLLSMVLYGSLVLINGKRLQDKLVRGITELTGVSPLEATFEKKRVKIGDFYSPYYVPYKDKRFIDCQVWGPSNLHLDGCVLAYCTFRHVQIVIVKSNLNIFGVTSFQRCHFTNCELANVTLFMAKDHYDRMVKENPEVGQYVPVLNG